MDTHIPPALSAAQMAERYGWTTSQLSKRRLIWHEGVHYARIPKAGTVYYWKEIDLWLQSFRTETELKLGSTSMQSSISSLSDSPPQKVISKRFKDRRPKQNNG